MTARLVLPLLLLATALAAQPATQVVVLDDCEAPIAEPWEYVGGWEFPGAEGALERDEAVKHGGAASYRLDADFTGGGAYVGLWRDLDDLVAVDVVAIRLWVKAVGTRALGVRLVDGTDQCHQKKGVTLADTDDWQELVLRVDGLVGEESWGGANDQKWHPGARGLGLNLGSDQVGADKKAQLWVDDLSFEIIPPGKPKLNAATFSQTSGRPGYGLSVTYSWDAEPLGRDFEAFVHFYGPNGERVAQGDYGPDNPTSTWDGPQTVNKTIVLDTNAPEGEWIVRTGLWYRPTGERIDLELGEGVVDMGDQSYEVGRFTVAADAPIPQLAPPTLDLTGYQITFDENFDGPLDVSREGPGTRWIAHTPYWGDFGDAGFGDPGPDGPFEIIDGQLHITAKRVGDRWQAGLLSSLNPKGEGFKQQYGYFETRAKLPAGPGTWPAFWLLSAAGVTDKSVDGVEIDVFEQYGQFPHALHTTVHRWLANGTHTGVGQPAIVEGMTTDFNTYGVLVEPDFITFYYNGSEIWKTETPAEAHQPLYVLVNLAMGGGWPIDGTPDPSVMIVDYVRVWAKQ